MSKTENIPPTILDVCRKIGNDVHFEHLPDHNNQLCVDIHSLFAGRSKYLCKQAVTNPLFSG